MISPLSTHLTAAIAALAIGAGGAWWTQGQRYGLQLEQLRHQQTSTELESTRQAVRDMAGFQKGLTDALATFQATGQRNAADRKSTRLNSSHLVISYAVFCLKKKKITYIIT